MTDHTPEVQEQSMLDALKGEGSPLSRYVLLVTILIIAMLCAVLSWLNPQRGQLLAGRRSTDKVDVPRLVPVLAGSSGSSSFVMVKPGLAGRDDIFFCTSVPTTTCDTNLTESPAVTEVWPVLDAAAEQVAYYGIRESSADLYLLELSDGVGIPLTVRAGSSGLHTRFVITTTVGAAFSPDGKWLVFPVNVRDSAAIELFAARSDGQQVLPVTDLGYQVRDYIWLDDETLIIAVRRPDGTLQHMKARLIADEFVTEELLDN